MFRVAFLTAAFLAAAVSAAPSPALAAEPSARALLSAEEQARRPAVARLNRAGQGHCTATLIAPDLALTAAHCLDPRGAASQVAADRLHVLAGWRTGAFVAHYRGTAAASVPGWTREALELDAALIRLAPVAGDPGAVAPYPVAEPPAPGARVAVLSYGHDRPEALSAEFGCTLTARTGDLLLTDCEATPGVSGAPLLALGADGAETLVGVVVAAAHARPPALRGPAVAVSAAALLPALRTALAEAEAEAAR